MVFRINLYILLVYLCFYFQWLIQKSWRKLLRNKQVGIIHVLIYPDCAASYS